MLSSASAGSHPNRATRILRFFHTYYPSQNPAQYSLSRLRTVASHSTGCCQPAPGRLALQGCGIALARLSFRTLIMLRLVFVSALIPGAARPNPPTSAPVSGLLPWISVMRRPVCPTAARPVSACLVSFRKATIPPRALFCTASMAATGSDRPGGETQVMWGVGLAQPGFRLYTGNRPGTMSVCGFPASAATTPDTFNGWGWQIGTGWQYRAVTLDIAATFRDRHDYNRETRPCRFAQRRCLDVITCYSVTAFKKASP